MDTLNLARNNLEGSLDFTRLPKSICQITVHENRFSGTIDLGNLPKSMGDLDVTNNALSGTVRVPHGLRAFLDENELTADPTKGHLSVVGWTSTPVLGEAKNLFKPLVVFLSWRRPY